MCAYVKCTSCNGQGEYSSIGGTRTCDYCVGTGRDLNVMGKELCQCIALNVVSVMVPEQFGTLQLPLRYQLISIYKN